MREPLASRIGRGRFERWLDGLTVLSESEGELCLGVVNRFVQEWIEARYLPAIRAALCEVAGREVDVRLVIDPELYQRHRAGEDEICRATIGAEARASVARKATDAESVGGRAAARAGAVGAAGAAGTVSRPARATGHPATKGVDARRASGPRFDDFVEGGGNRLAFQVIADALARPGRCVYNPIFIHGASGAGKSHLVRGFATAFAEQGAPERSDLLRVGQAPPAGPRVRAVSAERWFQHFAASAQDRTLSRFREFYRSLDVFVLDDIQALRGKGKTQLELLHTLDALIDAGKQVVVTADVAPRELVDLAPELVRRFVGGMVARIEGPDAATRLEILRRRADGLHGRVRDDVLRFLAENLGGDGHELVGALLRIDVHARVSRLALTVDDAHELVTDLLRARRRRASVERIRAEVARHFDIGEDELVGAARQRAVVHARHVAIWLARRFTGLSLVEIGRRFGGRNHSTVRSAQKKVAGLLQGGDERTIQEVAAIVERLAIR